MNSSKVKVLYLAGAGRSGSTILGSVLGQIDGLFYGGELVVIGRRGLVENRLCGTEVPFRESETWQRILKAGFGDLDAATKELTFTGNYDPLRKLPALLESRRQRFIESVEPFRAGLEKLYHAIRDNGPCRAIVDSSHLPLYGALLDSIPSIDLRVVHLVRDARAVAYSWLRKKVQPDTKNPWEMRRHPAALTTALWCASNLAVERYWKKRPMRLRYEDFVAQPRHAVERILEFMEEPATKLPFLSEHEVNLGPTDCVFGNPDRFRFGTVALRSDDEWSKKMGRADRAAATALAWPFLWRYGYFSRTAPVATPTDAVGAASRS